MALNDLGDQRRAAVAQIDRLFDLGLEWKRRALVGEAMVADLKQDGFLKGLQTARKIVQRRLDYGRGAEYQAIFLSAFEEVLVFLDAEIAQAENPEAAKRNTLE